MLKKKKTMLNKKKTVAATGHRSLHLALISSSRELHAKQHVVVITHTVSFTDLCQCCCPRAVVIDSVFVDLVLGLAKKVLHTSLLHVGLFYAIL